jgi:hypothetical protein
MGAYDIILSPADGGLLQLGLIIYTVRGILRRGKRMLKTTKIFIGIIVVAAVIAAACFLVFYE